MFTVYPIPCLPPLPNQLKFFSTYLLLFAYPTPEISSTSWWQEVHCFLKIHSLIPLPLTSGCIIITSLSIFNYPFPQAALMFPHYVDISVSRLYWGTHLPGELKPRSVLWLCYPAWVTRSLFKTLFCGVFWLCAENLLSITLQRRWEEGRHRLSGNWGDTYFLPPIRTKMPQVSLDSGDRFHWDPLHFHSLLLKQDCLSHLCSGCCFALEIFLHFWMQGAWPRSELLPVMYIPLNKWHWANVLPKSNVLRGKIWACCWQVRVRNGKRKYKCKSNMRFEWNYKCQMAPLPTSPQAGIRKLCNIMLETEIPNSRLEEWYSKLECEINMLSFWGLRSHVYGKWGANNLYVG